VAAEQPAKDAIPAQAEGPAHPGDPGGAEGAVRAAGAVPPEGAAAPIWAHIRRYVPIASWLPSYPREWLRHDVVASLTSWGVMVPVALAYAGLAGVPPEIGLTTAFAALAAYAVLGTSRHLKVTVSSTMAIMSASVVGDLAAGDGAAYLALTSALALTVGVILVVGGIARLGFISDFLTKSVVTGFIFGLAITIIVGQLPKLFGVPGGSGSVPAQLQQLVQNLPDTNPYTLTIGLLSLGLILGLRLVSRRIPGALIALVLGIFAVTALGLDTLGVTIVGEVQTGLPQPGIPWVPVGDIPFLILGAAGIVFLAVGESVGAGRAYAARHHYEIDADQELIALGAANLSSGLLGGFITDASLSQTATAEAAGVKSQLSSLFTSALILATAIFLAPLFNNLPNAVLGAIVIAAVLGLMDWREMRRYWEWRRTDFLIAMVALVGVVLTTVLSGLILAVLLSVTLLLYRASRPHIAALGRLPGERATFADLERHPEASPVPGLLMIRLDAPLYFFNANVARTQILELVAARRPAPRGVLIDMSATADLDVTATDMLTDLFDGLRARQIEVLLAQVKSSVRDRMRRTGLMGHVGEDRIYFSLGSAVADFQERWPADGDRNAPTDGDRNAPPDAADAAGAASPVSPQP
jgi:sulfate permease, SulP family